MTRKVLNCDCYDGCWGDHSKNWTAITVPRAMVAEERKLGEYYPVMSAVKKILRDYTLLQYGDYVVVDKHLRLSSERDVELVLKSIQELGYEPD